MGNNNTNYAFSCDADLHFNFKETPLLKAKKDHHGNIFTTVCGCVTNYTLVWIPVPISHQMFAAHMTQAVLLDWLRLRGSLWLVITLGAGHGLGLMSGAPVSSLTPLAAALRLWQTIIDTTSTAHASYEVVGEIVFTPLMFYAMRYNPVPVWDRSIFEKRQR